MGPKVFVIAEAGVNHDGSPAKARALVKAAAAAGADAVKFQTFRADELVSRSAQKAAYQKKTTACAESHWEMIRRLELGPRMHEELKRLCRKKGIEFMTTPFDTKSLDWLVKGRLLRRIKIPAGEIVNGPLLLAAARTGLPVILSTGMSTLKEVAEALDVLAFGDSQKGDPGRRRARGAWKDPDKSRRMRGRLTLLHCVTEYPAPPEEMNLRAMDTLTKTFGVPAGLSDHSLGITAAVAAAARGASVIEKHLTLDRKDTGPDHRSSIEPEDFKVMVKMIRQTELLLGDGRKVPSRSEVKNIYVVRKGLTARQTIRRGQAFTEENLVAKRPAKGHSPMRFWDLLGRRAARDYAPEEAIG